MFIVYYNNKYLYCVIYTLYKNIASDSKLVRQKHVYAKTYKGVKYTQVINNIMARIIIILARLIYLLSVYGIT